jgi:hypothetical protein
MYDGYGPVVFNREQPEAESHRQYGLRGLAFGRPGSPVFRLAPGPEEFAMNLILLLIVLVLVFGGGGFYMGGPAVGGGLGGLILIVLIVLLVSGKRL